MSFMRMVDLIRDLRYFQIELGSGFWLHFCVKMKIWILWHEQFACGFLRVSETLNKERHLFVSCWFIWKERLVSIEATFLDQSRNWMINGIHACDHGCLRSQQQLCRTCCMAKSSAIVKVIQKWNWNDFSCILPWSNWFHFAPNVGHPDYKNTCC